MERLTDYIPTVKYKFRTRYDWILFIEILELKGSQNVRTYLRHFACLSLTSRQPYSYTNV